MGSRLNVDELANSGGTGAPTLPYGLISSAGFGNYYVGTMGTGSSWSTTSNSYVDPTNSGGNTLTSVVSKGLTVTAGASTVPGITWTPSSVTAVYLVIFSFSLNNSTANSTSSAQITDGSVVLNQSSINQATSATFWTTVNGIYAPATVSPVTLKIQLKTSANTAAITGAGLTSFTLFQLAS